MILGAFLIGLIAGGSFGYILASIMHISRGDEDEQS